MAITAYTGTKTKDNISLLPYTGEVPSGGTYKEGYHFHISDTTLVISSSSDVEDNYFASRSFDNVVSGDLNWNVSLAGVVHTADHGQWTSAIEHQDNYFVYNSNTYWKLATFVNGTSYSHPAVTDKPTLSASAQVRFLPYQTTAGSTDFTWDTTQDAALRHMFDTGTFIPRKYNSAGPTDYLPYTAGKWRVIYFEDLTDSSLLPNGYGLWKAYDFDTEEEADVFIDIIYPPIITEITIPGPITVVIIGGGVIIGTVTGDTITGDIYTGTDIPNIDDLVTGTTTGVGDTDSLGNRWSGYPKVWRCRTSTNMPGNTEGHNNMWNIQGINMLEFKGWRMRDLFKYMPTTNPNDRDVR